MRAIILAGGKGTRLKPFTTTIPKPLVPIGGEMPILEIIVRQLAKHRFSHITVAVNHMANLIMAFFGDGARWGIKIDYSLEDTPLGTVGPLTLIRDLPETFLVMNGDVLCDLNYQELYEYHRLHGNNITISVFRRTVQSDFGVLEYDNDCALTSFAEKPVHTFDVSMGVYCINRSVIERLQPGKFYGFDNLMIDGIKNKEKIGVMVFHGYWLDIGRPEDYDTANENYPLLKEKLGINL